MDAMEPHSTRPQRWEELTLANNFMFAAEITSCNFCYRVFIL